MLWSASASRRTPDAAVAWINWWVNTTDAADIDKAERGIPANTELLDVRQAQALARAADRGEVHHRHQARARATPRSPRHPAAASWATSCSATAPTSCSASRARPTRREVRRRDEVGPAGLTHERHLRALHDPPVKKPKTAEEQRPLAEGGGPRQQGRLPVPAAVADRSGRDHDRSDDRLAVPVVHRLQPDPGAEVDRRRELRADVPRPAGCTVAAGHVHLRDRVHAAAADPGAGHRLCAERGHEGPGVLPVGLLPAVHARQLGGHRGACGGRSSASTAWSTRCCG